MSISHLLIRKFVVPHLFTARSSAIMASLSIGSFFEGPKVGLENKDTMSEETNAENKAQEEVQVENQESGTAENTDKESNGDASAEASQSEGQKEEDQLAALNDKYMRLYSEYDNFRRRTMKEKLELSKTAGEDVFKLLLPILDDFDRAMQSFENASDVEALKEGVTLIHQKMQSSLKNKGLEEMSPKGEVFDADVHEAITHIPAPSDDMKGKIMDVVEKGYSLNGKIIRYAKVVIGN